jgi:hypothetical protein
VLLSDTQKFSDTKTVLKTIKTSFNDPNSLIKEMKINVDDAIVAKCIIQGNYSLTDSLVKTYWKHLQYPDCSPSKADFNKLMGISTLFN